MKNILGFYSKFIHISWLGIKRNQYWKSGVFHMLLLILRAIFFVSFFSILGSNFYKIFAHFSHEKISLWIFSKYFLPVIYFTYLFRTFSKKNISLKIKHYLTLPVSKSGIISISLIFRTFNIYSITFYSFLISFGTGNIIPNYPWPDNLLWIIKLVLIVFTFEIAHVSARVIYIKKPLIAIASMTLLTALLILLRTNYTLYYYSYNFIGNVLGNNIFYWLIFIAGISLIFYASYLYIMSNLYIDLAVTSKTRRFELPAMSSIETKYPLISLQIRLILRNKILRNQFITGLLGIVFGVIANVVATKARFESQLFLEIFFVLMSAGYLFIAAYSIYVFGWEGYNMSYYFTKNIPIKLYIESKVSFIRILWLVFGGVNLLFIGILNKEYLLMVLSFSLYAIGVLSIIQPLQSILNFKPVAPNYSLLQIKLGTRYNNYVHTIFVAMPIAIFFFSRVIDHGRYFIDGLLIVCLAGLLGLLLQGKFTDYLYSLFLKKKYKFVEDVY